MIEKLDLSATTMRHDPQYRVLKKINEVIEAVNTLHGQSNVVIGTSQPHVGPHFVTGLSIAEQPPVAPQPLQEAVPEDIRKPFARAVDELCDVVRTEHTCVTSRDYLDMFERKIQAINAIFDAAHREYWTGEQPSVTSDVEWRGNKFYYRGTPIPLQENHL